MLILWRLSAVAVATLLLGCGGDSDLSLHSNGDSIAKVQAYVVRQVQSDSGERIPGSVHPYADATIESKLSGRITKILVKEGDVVKKGERLVEIDAHEMQARLDQALVSQRQAAQDLARFKELLPRGSVTRQEFDAVEARSRMADASVTEAQTVLGYARLEAPFDGVVTRKVANEGDLALPGKPLVMMEGQGLYRFEADVPETLAPTLKLGTRFPVQLAGLEGDVGGVLSEVSPTMDPNSRTLHVKLDLNKSTLLRSGQFGYVSIPTQSRPEIRVPERAIIQRGQIEAAFVISEGHALLRLVRTGASSPGSVSVLAGLSDGESIVVGDLTQLVDGQSVEVQP